MALDLKFFGPVGAKVPVVLDATQSDALNNVLDGRITLDLAQLELMKYQGFNPVDFRETVIKECLSRNVGIAHLSLLATTGALVGNKAPTDKFTKAFIDAFRDAVNDITAKTTFKVTYSEPRLTDITPARMMICMPVLSIRARITANNFCQVVYMPSLEDFKVSGFNEKSIGEFMSARWFFFTVVPSFLQKSTKLFKYLRLFHIIAIHTTEILRRKKKDTADELRSAFETSSSIFETQIGTNAAKLGQIKELVEILAKDETEAWSIEQEKEYKEYTKDIIDRLAPKKAKKGKKE